MSEPNARERELAASVINLGSDNWTAQLAQMLADYRVELAQVRDRRTSADGKGIRRHSQLGVVSLESLSARVAELERLNQRDHVRCDHEPGCAHLIETHDTVRGDGVRCMKCGTRWFDDAAPLTYTQWKNARA